MPGSHELAVLSEEWGIVDGEEHTHRRLVHGNRRKRLRILVIRNGIADFETVNAHHSADIAAFDLLDLLLSKAVENQELLDLLFLNPVIPLAEAYIHSYRKGASGNPADSNTADIRRIFK